MRLPVLILILLASVALSVALYAVTGGRFVFFALPLLFVTPLFGRGRRG